MSAQNVGGTSPRKEPGNHALVRFARPRHSPHGITAFATVAHKIAAHLHVDPVLGVSLTCEMAWPAFFVLSVCMTMVPSRSYYSSLQVPTPGVAADCWTRHPGRQAFFCECALVVGACTRQFTCHARSLAQENNGRAEKLGRVLEGQNGQRHGNVVH